MRFGHANLLALVMALVPLCGIAALAQGPTYGVGKAPTQAEIKALDISIGPEGKELPPGSGTAKEGEAIFTKQCMPCHGQIGNENKNIWPDYNRPLVGGRGTLTDMQPVFSIGSYWPYATALWDFIRRAMPLYKVGEGEYGVWEVKEGALSINDIYAVTAYLLYKNDIIKQDEVIDAKSLPKIPMPNRNGFLPADPRKWTPQMQQLFTAPKASK